MFVRKHELVNIFDTRIANRDLAIQRLQEKIAKLDKELTQAGIKKMVAEFDGLLGLRVSTKITDFSKEIEALKTSLNLIKERLGVVEEVVPATEAKVVLRNINPTTKTRKARGHK